MLEAISGATMRRKTVEEWAALFDGSAELSEGLHALAMVLNHDDRRADEGAHLNALRWIVKQLRRESEDHHQRVVDMSPRADARRAGA